MKTLIRALVASAVILSAACADAPTSILSSDLAALGAGNPRGITGRPGVYVRQSCRGTTYWTFDVDGVRYPRPDVYEPLDGATPLKLPLVGTGPHTLYAARWIPNYGHDWQGPVVAGDTVSLGCG